MRIVALMLLLMLLPGGKLSATLELEFQYFDNSEQDFAARGWLNSNSLFQQNILAAAALWAETFNSDASLQVYVTADRNVTRAGGTFSTGRFLFTDPAGNRVFEPGPLTRILTGESPGGPPDIFLIFNPLFLDTNYWLDPTPGDRFDEEVPLGQTDLVSIVLHEMGHGLGMAGRRIRQQGQSYGTLPGISSLMDNVSYFGGDGQPLDTQSNPNPMFFEGGATASIFGTDAQLSHTGPGARLQTQDFYHLGTCGDAAILVNSLMNGCRVPIDGSRMFITALDRAVFQDLGYPMKSSPDDFQINPGLNGSWANFATLGQGFFIDVLPDIPLVFLAWFTYDTTQPAQLQAHSTGKSTKQKTAAQVGDENHRWLTAQGTFDGNTAVLDVTLTTGGLFDDPAPVTNSPERSQGTITLTFEDCKKGTVEYNLNSSGLSGSVPIQRLAEDNVALCNSLNEAAQ